MAGRKNTLRLAAEDALQALVYLFAAQRVLGADLSHGDHGLRFVQDEQLMAPAGMLVAHAVELALNAYLSANGIRGGKSNHDLVGRLEACEDAGFFPDAKFKQYVLAINDAHNNKQFRYAKVDQMPFVSARGAIEMVRPTIERIHAIVSEKAYGTTIGLPQLPQKN
jgi:hypothetical protein